MLFLNQPPQITGIYDEHSGYDAYVVNGNYQIQSQFNGNYARGSFGDDLRNELNLTITEFDSTATANNEKIKLRINGEQKELAAFSGAMNKPQGLLN